MKLVFGELLIDLQYLPCLDYMTALVQTDRVQIEAHEQYQKQSYRNRCYVLTANKVDALAVPVQHGTRHQPIRDLRIDNEQPWQTHHWRTIQASYGKAPFFEYYAPDFEIILRKNQSFLLDLNLELLTLCLKLLGVGTPINLTECYEKIPPPGLFDARSRINPRNGPGKHLFYHPEPYMQNFGQNFVPNLSIIDLLFCQGPDACQYLV